MKYPSWLKVNISKAKNNRKIREVLGSGLHTVCESALCPNRGECFEHGTVTFMILGSTCSRQCTFCAVQKGTLGQPDPDEPRKLAETAKKLNLSHIVVTSVTRDDLPDGGAGHWAETIRTLRSELPEATVEVLTPDFQGRTELLDIVLAAKPHVFNHNVETIARLYPALRPQAGFEQSLAVLRYAKQHSKAKIKSGLMVGLGETEEEVKTLLQTLQATGVDIVTIGQYIAPSKQHYPIQAFITPEKFVEYKTYGESLGIPYVFSAPLVRSSYMAKEALQKVKVSLSDLCG